MPALKLNRFKNSWWFLWMVDLFILTCLLYFISTNFDQTEALAILLYGFSSGVINYIQNVRATVSNIDYAAIVEDSNTKPLLIIGFLVIVLLFVYMPTRVIAFITEDNKFTHEMGLILERRIERLEDLR